MERSRIISKLSALLSEGNEGERVESYEELIIEEIDKFVKEDVFYSLQTSEILKVVEKSGIRDPELLCELVRKMSERKGKEAPLLLNVISSEDATLEECVKVISCFGGCPICRRAGELFKEEERLAERDYQNEINRLNEEIEELKKNTENAFSSSHNETRRFRK